MNHETHLASKIASATNLNVATCYQCGKCAAGCPLANDMDLTSSAVLRLLQYNTEATDTEVLRSKAIWLCLSCEMCLSRCPNQVDIPKMMDFLRQESVRLRLTHPASRNILRFHRSFLDQVQYTGRSFEVGLVLDYKLRSKRLFDDLAQAPRMFLKGKLRLLPEFIKKRKEMQQLFKQTLNNQGQSIQDSTNQASGKQAQNNPTQVLNIETAANHLQSSSKHP